MNDQENNLSPQGQLRQQQILQQAILVGRKRVYRRRLASNSVVALVIMGIAAMVIYRSGSPIEPMPAPVAQVSVPPTQGALPAVPKPVVVQIIQNDPSSFLRMTQPSNTRFVKIIGDNELITAMRDAGQPVGLAYLNGRLYVMKH